MTDSKKSSSTKSDILKPADIDEILEQYNHLLKTYPNQKNAVYANYKRTIKRLDVLFPFIEHPVHGITGLHALEKYDEAGYVRTYNYNWKIIIPKMGVQKHHISGWGNEPHDDPGTPEEFKIETEPHHHHYDLNDRKKRRENYDVRTLEQAFEFISYYLISGKEYKG
ncbi:toxin-antitoxin system TumE family protein [Virgibacillus sediminis]|uniref:DUF6516 family protein n=1 Tax=Virgibacillus sediminis TaxID=202260 RepID=A0ABV7A7X8_9BACI